MPIHGSVPNRIPASIPHTEHISITTDDPRVWKLLASADCLLGIRVHITTGFQERASADSPCPEKTDDFLYTSWVEVWNIVEQVPHDHLGQKNLVEFVRCLRGLPLAPSEIQKVDVWGTRKRLWQDLPFFQEIALEEVNSLYSRQHTKLNNSRANDTDILDTDINFDFERNRWRNFHAFIARLTGSDVVDFSKYALWEFRDVVEARDVTAGFLDFRISVAVTWLLYTGDRLLSYVSAEKWESWKVGFEAIEGDDGVEVSKATREVVKDLVKTMQGFELNGEKLSTEPLSQ